MEFRILGPLQVFDGRRELTIGGPGQRALLALLLLRANTVVTSDLLVDELWPAEPPASGTTALQVRISQLRRALGAGAERLETVAAGYRFRVARDELDLDRFSRLIDEAAGADPATASEQLGEALALWRGPPLADLAYEPFAQAAAGRLEELRLAALERRIDADLALGRDADLVPELEALVAEEPLREHFRGQLMLALYRSGRQTDALQAYRNVRETLAEQLGLEPSPALQALERSILVHDPELDLTRPERSILVAAADDDTLELLLSLAEPLARRPRKELILLRTVEAADTLGAAAAAAGERRAALVDAGIAARAAAVVSRESTLQIATEQDVDLVLVHGTVATVDDELLAHVPCDLAILVGAPVRRGPVLVPFVGATHDWSAVELAAWAAGALDVPLVLAGPVEEHRDSSRLLASASLAVQLTLGVVAEPLLVEPGAEAVAAAAAGASLTVIGLPERWRERGLGPVRSTLATESEAPVVLVRRGLRPGGIAPNAARTRFTWSITP